MEVFGPAMVKNGHPLPDGIAGGPDHAGFTDGCASLPPDDYHLLANVTIIDALRSIFTF